MTPKISVPRGACQLAGRVPHEKGTTQTMQQHHRTSWPVRVATLAFAAACVPVVSGWLIVAALAVGIDG